MRSPWLTLAMGVAAVAALVGALAWEGGRPGRSLPAPPVVTPAEAARAAAHERLVGLVRASRALMPEGYGNVSIGTTVAQLQSARPSVLQGRPTSDRRTAVWEESEASGTRVVYLVAPDLQVVTQVQFMSRLADGTALLADFRAQQARYGDPTGFWECPEAANASPTRRITWTGRDASVMLAILVTPTGISTTLVVAASDDVRHALARSRCHGIAAEDLAHWPVAQELRGEDAPFAHPR